MGATYSQLIPVQELTPGQISNIRNSSIQAVVAMASRELSLAEDRLVVRDIRPMTDLEMYDADAATGTAEDWIFDTATSGTGYKALCASRTMADQRYVCIFGVRDLRTNIGTTAINVTAAGTVKQNESAKLVSLLRFTVGGAYKVIWDTNVMEAYKDNMVAFSPSVVIIPQNVSYQIEAFKDAAKEGDVMLQLIGVVVEPRGLVISP